MSAVTQLNSHQNSVCSDHFAQYYNNLQFLIASLEEYIKKGIENNEGLLIIAAETTWIELLNSLRSSKINAAELFASGQLRYLDAEKAAQAVMTSQGPDRGLFYQLIHPEIDSLRESYKSIRCYGEVVNVLCEQGKSAEAVLLEGYWNEFLGTQNHITLMCGYNNAYLPKGKHAHHLNLIGQCHSSTIDSEKIDAAVSDEQTLKRLAALEMKVIALTLELNTIRERESDLEETLKGLLNIEKFASLNQICLLLAHKLRNPLQVIRSTSEQLFRGSPENGADLNSFQNGAKRLENAADTITELVQNILETFNRPK